MSLQTPRELAGGDVALLRAAAGAPTPAPAKPAPAKPAPAKPAPAKPTAAKPTATKPAPPEPAKSPKSAKPARTAPAERSIAGARGRLFAGAADEALAIALEVWRSRRLPELAELVARLGTHTGGERVLEGKRPKDRIESFDKLLERGDPADFARLASGLFLTNSGRDVGARLELLGTWSRDPRLADVGHELLQRVPFTATSARPFWKSLFATLTKVADPRTEAIALAAQAHLVKAFEGRDDYVGWLPRQCQKLAAAVRAENPTPPAPLDDAEREALAAMLAHVAGAAAPSRDDEVVRRLYAEVYANPSSDEARAVLADKLIECGDPHGEFIAIQLGAKRSAGESGAVGIALSLPDLRRAKAILDDHADAWLGPLAHWTRKKDRVFERGFLARCTVQKTSGAAGEFPFESPIWHTVKEISGPVLPLAMLRRMSVLERLIDVRTADLGELAHAAPPLEHLAEVKASGKWDPSFVERLGAAPGLPALRRLRVDVILAQQAEPTLSDVRAMWTNLPATIESLRVEIEPIVVRLVRIAGSCELEIHYADGVRHARDRADQMLRRAAHELDFATSLKAVVTDYHRFDRTALAAKQHLLNYWSEERVRALVTGARHIRDVTVEARILETGEWARMEEEM